MTRIEINDWRQRIIQAEERWAQTFEGFTQFDRDDAGGWRSCAVGEAFRKASKKVKLIFDPHILNDNFWNGPTDRSLQRLGMRFSDAVNSDDFLLAYKLIDLIEARVMVLRAKKAA